MAYVLLALMLLIAVAATAALKKALRLKLIARDRPKHLDRANAQFSRVVIASRDPHFALDVSTAEVMSDSETSAPRYGAYRFTRIVRNEFGEYFMLKSTPGSEAFVKHVSQEAARVILKSRYLPPDRP
ncbi:MULTISPECIES: hypothetical protein [unclassified Variovorax]|uniref:hypothetical protein n=1 Tax=unclassified Variovorax TaxID=663243 RepID=UPI003F448A07